MRFERRYLGKTGAGRESVVVFRSERIVERLRGICFVLFCGRSLVHWAYKPNQNRWWFTKTYYLVLVQQIRMTNQQDTPLRIMILGTNVSLVGLGVEQFGAFDLGVAILSLGLLVTIAGFVR